MKHDISCLIAMQHAFTEMTVALMDSGDDLRSYTHGIQLIGQMITDEVEETLEDLNQRCFQKGSRHDAA